MEVFRSPQQSNPSWVTTAELELIERLLCIRTKRPVTSTGTTGVRASLGTP
jgi:hypothetical protein